ncbi:ABC transporter ATP-binding protein [Spiroplasma sp. DGKH1]|uniref:ABC transporter ATP-binding protein n=1 Tax=Spiroplasma sp. DGKH1 TaxID=3050074 RepID=UPI0034C5F6A9
MIQINDLNKNYGKKIANFNINININVGEVYGILGPNGAGKTTLIRQIMGFIKSDTGTILIDGLNPWTDAKQIMKSTGYVAGEISLYDNLTGIEYLKLITKFRPEVDWTYVEKLLLHFDLDASQKIKRMSKGMKQKTALIAATMIKPKFLVLDEPTSGLDPVMKNQFNELIIKMKQDYQTTILICSHVFEEVTKLCDRIGFIKNGKLIDEVKVVERDINKIEEHFKKLYERESVL